MVVFETVAVGVKNGLVHSVPCVAFYAGVYEMYV